jgi:acyl-CoA reductase-like NAD-dependent aldehyde dehydrogenase
MPVSAATTTPDVIGAAQRGFDGVVPLYHGGSWHEAASGETFETVEPATGATLAIVAEAGIDDLDSAIAAAESAAVEWGRLPARKRGDLVGELAARVREQAAGLALLDARDNGSPLSAMRADAEKGAGVFAEMAGLATEMKGQTIPVGRGQLNYTTLEPWGLVARIIAFNHPVLFACARSAPALVAGNAVILKPSELAPLGALAIAQLADGLLPPGVLSVLAGGPALGAAIVSDPRIRRLSFTGSLATGLKVSAGAAASGVIKTITLELGGKNPIIVCEDADLDAAADAVVRGMNFTRVQGQSCGSTSRLLVHESLHDPILERVAERVARIRIGMPTEEGVDMGALISRAAQQRTLAFIDRAVADGARLVIGGGAPDDPRLAGGAFVMPTVLDGVREHSELACEEVFGPVLAVMSWTDEREAIRLANTVRYGLTASIWSRDFDRAFRLADAVEAGYVWVNDVESRYPGVPFGGWKDSGSGLENGIDELVSFTRTKTVNLRYRTA